MFCTNCGKNISRNAEFCIGCGKKSSGAKGNGKNKPRYFWLFRIIKWMGYPVLFFLIFMAFGVDIYYFGNSKTVIAISILAGILLIILMVILQKYVKLFRYMVTGLLTLSVLTGLVLSGVAGYRYLSPSLLVTVVKGPVNGAAVSIYELAADGSKGKLIKGPFVSDASGNVNFGSLPNLPKRLFIEAKGGSYLSEATGQMVFLKDTDTLTAVLPASAKNVSVTPFTHMAAALAQAKIKGGEAPDKAVISANEAVAKQYGLKSILDTIPASNGTKEEKLYGLTLGGFAQLAKNLDMRSIDLANALAKDWSDGALDGKENNKPITISGGPMLGNAGTAGLSNATTQFAKSGKSYSPKESTVTVNPPPDKTVFRITTTSLPAWISGQTGSYTIATEGGSPPLTWSIKSGSIPPGFSLSQDGIISGSYILPAGVTKKIFPSFTLEVKDQQGKTQTVTLSLTVTQELPTISVINPPTLTVGQSYEELIAIANGGMPPYQFGNEVASGPIPMGMQIIAIGNKAYLTGSPKAKGNFYFRVCVIDDAKNEKCGDRVAFAVKDKEAVTPAPAPTPTLKPGIEGWDGDYYGASTYISGPSKYCSSGAVPYKASVKNNRVTYTRDVLSTPSDQGYIDSSGSVKELSRSEYEGIYQDYDTLQFYKSNGKAYLKGTGIGITDRSPDYVAKCTWDITAEREN